MKVALWAEIRRLSQVEGLSQTQIAKRLRCCPRTVKAALALDRPPDETKRAPRGSRLDPYKPKIDALVAKYPELTAVRILEEIRKGPDGYTGRITVLREYLARVEFYRALVHALEFFGGSPKQVIFDNLKAAVLNGSGKQACLHGEFLAVCGHFCLEPIACTRRDPESKGMVEAGVRYIKRNALQGRDEELTCWEDYGRLAVSWRDEVANVRLHHTTRERPLDRFEQERQRLRPLPALAFDTDEVVPAVVSSHARIHFDGNQALARAARAKPERVETHANCGDLPRSPGRGGTQKQLNARSPLSADRRGDYGPPRASPAAAHPAGQTA
jgi:transposase